MAKRRADGLELTVARPPPENRALARMDDLSPWRVAGTYFESCNCEAICRCQMIGDRPGGGRSSYGVCFGALFSFEFEGSCAFVSRFAYES